MYVKLFELLEWTLQRSLMFIVFDISFGLFDSLVKLFNVWVLGGNGGLGEVWGLLKKFPSMKPLIGSDVFFSIWFSFIGKLCVKFYLNSHGIYERLLVRLLFDFDKGFSQYNCKIL